MADNVVPTADGAQDLGTPAKSWGNIYGKKFYKDGVEFTGESYTNANSTPQTVGGIPAGSTFSDKTMTQMWDSLLYPDLNPTLTAPSTGFSSASSGLREIGELLATMAFSASFSRGAISPAYGTSGYRSGLPNTYNYTGTGLPATYASTSLTDSQSISNYTVISGAQSWTAAVSYDAGEQPKTSNGNNYSSPLSAGTTSSVAVTITGVYPYFATTSNVATLTKQSLASMSSSYVQTNMAAEDDTDKQKADFPTAWSTITGVQFYNTVSSTWEWINGSKANSLATFTTSSVTQTVQGNTVNYTRYTHNGAKIGSRQLRWYTT